MRGGREGGRTMLLTETELMLAAAMGGGTADDAAPLSMKTEGAREAGAEGEGCYLGNSDDVMWRVVPCPDWLKGRGAPLA